MAPPGVGSKKLVHNTRERVLSGDHNREQAFKDQMLAEVLRCTTDARFELDTQAGSVEVFSDGTEALPSATIFAGIRARPEVGTTNLFIEPGTLSIVDNPAPSGDESKLAFVVDPGVQTAGVLTLTAGSGGAIRIDVIECQRVETVIETDSRDIFNPTTGLFTPVLVDKVSTGRLVYRIRTGTPGAGFPGIAAGWLPLAVCSVPAAAVTWDDVILWDVRPLAHERVQQPFNAYPTLNYVHRQLAFCDVDTAPGEIRMTGVLDVSFGGYRAGGQVLSPGSSGNAYFDIADSTYWAGSLSSANAMWYLYLVFPFGLPRWVQYCPASAGIREPRGLRGIPVISRWTPRLDGRPNSVIAQTPAWTGLQDSPSQDAVVAVAGRQKATGGPEGITSDGRVVNMIDSSGFEVSASTSSGDLYSQFDLTDNATHPGNARAIYVRFKATLNVTGNGQVQFSPLATVGGPNNTYANNAECALQGPIREFIEISVNGSYDIGFVARVPLAYSTSSPRGFKLRWDHTFSGSATWSITGRKISVIGWELGP